MSPYVVVALLMVGVSTSTGMDTCKIDCTHNLPFTADPVDCRNYYICYGFFEHSEFPFTCDSGMFFDLNSHTCLSSGYKCTPDCEKCSFDCAAPVLGKRASTVDCGVYFDCEHNDWISCSPDDPYFDGHVCQKDEYHCCTCKSSCSDYDVANHVMVPDYRNCTNFYLCLEPGIPDESTHGHCPSGNYDSQRKTCTDDAPCIQPCA
ncbi:hypothetical protein GWK47_018761 [Chionoecetes opilio]|uniref:Chitin-binding type-2 domain-containing protein n=1 Tax=Chionoecetes opilio TaxID=41210 RepID=A0A8J4XRB0_CHIOP|nr:hypothetical protein GWK47_018761 [Chionoecetes opilio]